MRGYRPPATRSFGSVTSRKGILEVAARFRAGGAVLLGKLGTYEFAFGGPSFDLPFPPTRNPWNLDHVTGGSSSGSAAA